MTEAVIADPVRENAERCASSFAARSLRCEGLPRHLRLEITNNCNLFCSLSETTKNHGGCSQWLAKKRIQHMPLPLFKKVIDELAPILTECYPYNFGEPFMNPEACEMLAYARARNPRMKMEIHTNGHYFRADDQRRAVVESGLDLLNFSVDGLAQETYEQYRIKGDLAAVLDAIRGVCDMKRRLGADRLKVSFQFIVFDHNIHEVPRVDAFARQLGVDDVRIKVNLPHVLRRLRERFPDIARALAPDSESEFGPSEGFCDFPWTHVTILADGRAVACCRDALIEEPLGSVAKASVAEVFNSPAYVDYRRRYLANERPLPGACKECPAAPRAPRAWEPEPIGSARPSDPLPPPDPQRTSGPRVPSIEELLRDRFFGLRWPVVKALWRLRLRRKLFNYLLAETEMKLRRARLWASPYWLVIDPMCGCDLQCPFCPTGKEKGTRTRKALGFEEFRRIIDPLGPSLLQVEFCNWGEPLLNPRIYDMIGYAKKFGLETHLSTNLNRFSKEDAEKLVDSGLDFLVLSIDGASPETYSRYRVGGDFNRVIENVRLLVEARARRGLKRPYINWQFLVFRHNEHEIEKAKAMGKELGVDVVAASPAAIPWPDWVPEKEGAFLYPERKEPGVETQTLLNRDDYLKLRSASSPLCVWPWIAAVVNANGSVSPCCGTEDEKDDYGNALETPPRQLFNNKDFRTARAFLASGRASGVENACARCACVGKANMHIPFWWDTGELNGVPLEELFAPAAQPDHAKS